MTNHKHKSRNTRIGLAVVATMLACAMSGTTQAHVPDQVKNRYDYQKRDLRTAHLHEMKLIRAEYKGALAETAAARRGAVKLCEPNRTYALQQIKATRLAAGERYRNALLVERKSYRLAVAELEAWYASARSRHHHSHVAVTTVPVQPTYVVDQTTTYSVPNYSVETISPAPVAPQYEVIQPEGPVLNAPAFEGNAPAYEGPVFESPVIEGPVLQGPVLQGPANHAPATGIEFMPTVSLGTSRPSAVTTVRPVQYSTKTTKVMVTRPTVVTGVDHSHVHGGSRNVRGASFGNLILRALAR